MKNSFVASILAVVAFTVIVLAMRWIDLRNDNAQHAVHWLTTSLVDQAKLLGSAPQTTPERLKHAEMLRPTIEEIVKELRDKTVSEIDPLMVGDMDLILRLFSNMYGLQFIDSEEDKGFELQKQLFLDAIVEFRNKHGLPSPTEWK
jgi:hypothetical protein